MMAKNTVLTFTDRGIYCPAGDFYIDPWRPVARALITHGHSDHARPGHGAYLATHASGPVIRHRLGPIALDGIAYGESAPDRWRFSVLSSGRPCAGIGANPGRNRAARSGWFPATTRPRMTGLSEPFAPVACHTFITECTFGLPVFRWQAQAVVAGQINRMVGGQCGGGQGIDPWGLCLGQGAAIDGGGRSRPSARS